MEYLNEAQRLAIKQAFIRITTDQSWPVMRQFAEEVIYELEQKSLQEDDEEKARALRYDARGARKFWQKWLRAIELTKQGEQAINRDDFLEVVM